MISIITRITRITKITIVRIIVNIVIYHTLEIISQTVTNVPLPFTKVDQEPRPVPRRTHHSAKSLRHSEEFPLRPQATLRAPKKK